GAERLYGYTAPEAIGQPISLLAPADRQEEVRQLLDRVRRGLSVERFETRRVRKDGREVQVSLTISPLRDATGRVVGSAVMARDITEQTRMEEALRDSEAKLRAVVSTAVDAVLTIDERGTIDSVNPAAERMFGYTAPEMVGQNVRMLMPSPYR